MTDNRKTNKNRHSLAFILFWWFVSLPIGPLLILGFSEYHADKDNIIRSKSQQLESISFLLTQRVNDFFETILTNMYINSEKAVDMLQDMKATIDANNYKVADFLQSNDYQQIINSHANTYIDLLRFYSYKDIFLIDTNGNILYAVNSKKVLGKNLLVANNSSKLENILTEALKEHNPKYADLVYFFGELSNLYILPLLNKDNLLIGFFAIELTANNIQDIFLKNQDLYKEKQSYLANKDGLITYSSDVKYTLDNRLIYENQMYVDWQKSLVKEKNKEYNEFDILEGYLDDIDQIETNGITEETEETEETFIYENSFKKEVIGYYSTIDISGTKQVLISEILLSDALSSAVDFRNRIIIIIGVTFVLLLILALFISSRLVQPIKTINNWVNKVASGDYVEGSVLEGSLEITELSNSFYEMSSRLRKISKTQEDRTWLQEGMSGLHNSIRGELAIEELASNIIGYFAHYLDIHCGAIYVLQEDKILQLVGTFAWSKRKQTKNQFIVGEGLIGQVALEKRIIELTNIPEDFIDIETGMGIAKPTEVIIMPLLHEDNLKGVIEFANLTVITAKKRKFIDMALPSVAVAINSAQYRYRVNRLLETTTNQSATLKQQQQDLQQANNELGSRARFLEESENKLKLQSQALQKSNKKLEEKSQQLMLQKKEIEEKNKDIKDSNRQILEKAKELEQTSAYKSEFLANMSHELRTPLNSMLLLAKMLYDNETKNLTEDQVDSAKVIFNSGNDLLCLINDILDLSKVEAGKLSVLLEEENIKDIIQSLQALFKPLANDKGLEFDVNIADNVPETIVTDKQRLLQILKNFLSNAFKFTKKGEVRLNITNSDNKYLSLEVKDSGIGIPEEKQDKIFASFQQADGSISRQYGGTGLGLSISMQLAKLLKGDIKLISKENAGTSFILFIPLGNKISTKSDIVPIQKNKKMINNNVITHTKIVMNNESLENSIDEDVAINTDDLQQKKLMIIDDNMRNAFDISGKLERTDAEVVLLDSIDKLATATEKNTIDIIIYCNPQDNQQLTEINDFAENNKNIIIIIASKTTKQLSVAKSIKLIDYPVILQQLIQCIK